VADNVTEKEAKCGSALLRRALDEAESSGRSVTEVLRETLDQQGVKYRDGRRGRMPDGIEAKSMGMNIRAMPSQMEHWKQTAASRRVSLNALVGSAMDFYVDVVEKWYSAASAAGVKNFPEFLSAACQHWLAEINSLPVRAPTGRLPTKEEK